MLSLYNKAKSKVEQLEGKLLKYDIVKYKLESLNEEQVGEAGPDPYFFLRDDKLREYGEEHPQDFNMAYGRRKYRRGRGKSRGRGRYSSAGGKRARIGEAVGTSNCKTDILINNEGPLEQGDRTQYNYPLINLQAGQEINQRNRQVVNFRGWKMDFELVNTQNSPLYFNIAIIATKGGSNTSEVVTADFFRYHNNDRAINFDTGRSGLEFHTLPINTDRYTVLKHKRMLLKPQRGDNQNFIYEDDSGRNYRRFRWYVKLKRQIRWDASQAVPETGQVFLVYWAAKFGSFSNDSSSPNAFAIHKRIVQYFRDTQN